MNANESRIGRGYLAKRGKAVGRGSQHRESRGRDIIVIEQKLILQNPMKRILTSSTILEPKPRPKKGVSESILEFCCRKGSHGLINFSILFH